MAWPRSDHGLWPRTDEERLLHAALDAATPARAAFAQWAGSRAPDRAGDLESGERRLLPMVAWNLGASGLDRAWAEACAVLARTADERNRAHRRIAADAATLLARAGVPTLALKGIVLAAEHYAEPGLRPMTDVDLMVHAADRERALAALVAAGWRARPTAVALRPHLCAFELERAADGAELDLHQYLNEYGSNAEAEQGLWQRSHALDLDGVPTLAPSPTDLLLHVCVAAMKAGRRRNTRWVVDAMTILRRPAAIDFDLLAQAASLRGVVLPVRECLGYLAEAFAAPIPTAFLEALWRAPVDEVRRRRYRALTREPASLPDLARDYRAGYEFGTEAAAGTAGLIDFGTFAFRQLLYRWRLERAVDLPSAIVAHLPRAWAMARGSARR